MKRQYNRANYVWCIKGHECALLKKCKERELKMSREILKSSEEKFQDLNGKWLFILNYYSKQILLSWDIIEPINLTKSWKLLFNREIMNKILAKLTSAFFKNYVFCPVRSYEIIKYTLGQCGQCYEVYEIYKIERGFWGLFDLTKWEVDKRFLGQRHGKKYSLEQKEILIRTERNTHWVFYSALVVKTIP